ncbi:MAG: hypothetical protein WCK37_02895 [Candidatus Falkowbacteria bacterium]
MTKSEMIERVYGIIFANAIDCKHNPKTFKENLNLVGDLNLSQISLVDIARDINVDFGISFGYMEISGWRTIFDVIVTVSSHVKIEGE